MVVDIERATKINARVCVVWDCINIYDEGLEQSIIIVAITTLFHAAFH